MIVFGWGKTTTKNFGETLPTHCSICNNDVYYFHIRQKEWFTLFFIPIFPYEVNHYLLCPVCEKGYTLEKNSDKEIAEEMRELTASFLEKKTSPKSYQKKLDKLLKDFMPVEEEGIDDRTETEIELEEAKDFSDFLKYTGIVLGVIFLILIIKWLFF